MKGSKLKKQCGNGQNCTNSNCPFPHPLPNTDEVAVIKKVIKYSGGLPYGLRSQAFGKIPILPSEPDAKTSSVKAHAIPTNDITLTCLSCKDKFVLTVNEQVWFISKKFSNPKICKECRKLRRNLEKHASQFDILEWE